MDRLEIASRFLPTLYAECNTSIREGECDILGNNWMEELALEALKMADVLIKMNEESRGD